MCIFIAASSTHRKSIATTFSTLGLAECMHFRCDCNASNVYIYLFWNEHFQAAKPTALSHKTACVLSLLVLDVCMKRAPNICVFFHSLFLKKLFNFRIFLASPFCFDYSPIVFLVSLTRSLRRYKSAPMCECMCVWYVENKITKFT